MVCGSIPFFFFFFNVTTQCLLSGEVHFDFFLGIRFWVSLFRCIYFFSCLALRREHSILLASSLCGLVGYPSLPLYFRLPLTYSVTLFSKADTSRKSERNTELKAYLSCSHPALICISIRGYVPLSLNLCLVAPPQRLQFSLFQFLLFLPLGFVMMVTRSAWVSTNNSFILISVLSLSKQILLPDRINIHRV